MSADDATSASSPARAVIFDLDGTLTLPDLDFAEIRREIGGIEGPILEALEGMPTEDRARACEILARHEALAAARARLQPFAAEVLENLARQGVRTAILTRNSRASLDRVLDDHGLHVDALRTREDGAIKPSPEPVLALCAELGVAAERAIVVGDYLFDLQSARAAGATAVLLRNDSNTLHEAAADVVIDDLSEVLALIADTGLGSRLSS